MASSSPLLITGASGFVGANLCRHFLERGHEVLAIENPGGQSWRLEGLAGLRHGVLDLTDEKAVLEFLAREKPAVILNFAAYGAYSSQTNADRIYSVNFDAVRTLLEGASRIEGFKAFIQAGTSSEYGFNCAGPSEETSTCPDSDYAVAKVGASSLIQYYGKKKNVPAWSLRLYSVYGPDEEISRLMPKLLIEGQSGRYPPLVNPRISRDFIHVEDVARAFEAVLARADRLPRGEIYNIGSGTCTSLETLVAVARKLFSIPEAPRWGTMPDRHWDHRDWYSDSRKALRDLEWKAEISLEDGLKKTISWMQANPDRMEAARRHSILSRAKTTGERG